MRPLDFPRWSAISSNQFARVVATTWTQPRSCCSFLPLLRPFISLFHHLSLRNGLYSDLHPSLSPGQHNIANWDVPGPCWAVSAQYVSHLHLFYIISWLTTRVTACLTHTQHYRSINHSLLAFLGMISSYRSRLSIIMTRIQVSDCFPL